MKLGCIRHKNVLTIESKCMVSFNKPVEALLFVVNVITEGV